MKRIKEFRSSLARFMMRSWYIALLALLIPAGAVAGQPCHCSQQFVLGTYAWTIDGTGVVTLPDTTQKRVPVAALGVVTIDNEGIISVSGYLSIAGQIIRKGIDPEDPSYTGVMTINSDCTGILEWDDGGVVELIVHSRGDEITGIMVSGNPVLSDPMITGRWKRISWTPVIHGSGGRRPYLVGGTYITRMSGVDILPGVPTPVPEEVLGFSYIGYDGTMEGSSTAMFPGMRVPVTIEDGAWEEGELAYTGMTTGSLMAGGAYRGELENWSVILDGGNEIWGIFLSNPTGGTTVSLVTSKRVSYRTPD